jgi:protein TonB
MFEQSILANAPKVRRVWAASLGVTGQVFLVGAMILAPMLWPEAMPHAAFTMLVPHAPPGTRAKGKEDAKPHRVARAARPFQYRPTGFIQPTNVPAAPLRIVDSLDTGMDLGSGVIGGTGDPTGVPGGILTDLIESARELPRPTPTPRPAEPAKKPEPVIERRRVGGVVREPKVIYRVDPRYPDIAKRAGISGVVRLTGIIGIDGHIRALAVAAGNPLLAPAAVEAVRQWVYEPTRLNDNPIEVETEIVVTFTLNR